MNRYQLAKIIEWAGTLDTRKRMQKVVYLLQVAGCPLEAEYTLHHYGPYSQDVARLTDEMVQAHLLIETAVSNPVGQQYSYRIDESARQNISAFEATPQGRIVADQMKPFQSKALELVQTDLKDLEFASTTVFFRKQGYAWPVAIEKMCQFKGLPSGSPVVMRAEGLARQFIA